MQEVVVEKIPDAFIYEEIDGKPVYYRGYRKALAQNKNAEDIVGCSDVQGIIISVVLEYLYRNISLHRFSWRYST